MKSKPLGVCALIVICAFAAQVLRSDVMIRPVAADPHGVWFTQGAWDVPSAQSLIDVTSYVSGVTDVASYLATNPNGGGGAQGPGGHSFNTLSFDLGVDMQVTGMVLWNASNFYGQNVMLVSLRAVSEQGVATDLSYFWTNPDSLTPQWIQFAPVTARYMNWTSSWAQNGRSSNVAEVAFTGTGVPVPEGGVGVSCLGALLLCWVALAPRRARG
jgi:hypothetical protein